ncbi:MAG: BamA/TamA family outer membrane protein [Bacteroidales bacterium]
MKLYLKYKGNLRLILFISVFQISLNLHAQLTSLRIIPVDEEGRNVLKKSQISAIRDSSEGIKKLRLFSESWMDKGYLTFGIDSLITDSSSLVAKVYFGKKYLLNNFRLKFIPVTPEDAVVVRKLKPGRYPLTKKSLSEIRKSLLEHYANSGYPFTQITFDSLDTSGENPSGIINILKNTPIVFDSILLKGNPRISARFVYHTIDIKPGDIYNQLKINNLDKVFSRLAYLKMVKPAEVEFKKNKADLFLYLKDKPAGYFNGIIGFASGNKDSGALQVTGNLNLLLNNLFKVGDKIDLYWDKYSSKSQNLRFGLQFPYLFFIPVGLSYKLNLEKSNIDYLNIGNQLALSYRLNSFSEISAYISSKKSFLINNSDSNSGLAEYSWTLAGLGFSTDKTDYSFNPRKGFQFELTSGYGNRAISSSVKVFEADFKGGLYIPLGKQGTLALLNKSGIIYSDSGFYANELIKLGGINSIRGFNEQSIPASAYTIFTLEPRLFFGQNSNLFAFSDFAIYKVISVENSFINRLVGLGLGLNLDTKAGVFRIIYALGKEQQNPLKLSNSKIHIGFNARF